MNNLFSYMISSRFLCIFISLFFLTSCGKDSLEPNQDVLIEQGSRIDAIDKLSSAEHAFLKSEFPNGDFKYNSFKDVVYVNGDLFIKRSDLIIQSEDWKNYLNQLDTSINLEERTDARQTQWGEISYSNRVVRVFLSDYPTIEEGGMDISNSKRDLLMKEMQKGLALFDLVEHTYIVIEEANNRSEADVVIEWSNLPTNLWGQATWPYNGHAGPDILLSIYRYGIPSYIPDPNSSEITDVDLTSVVVHEIMHTLGIQHNTEGYHLCGTELNPSSTQTVMAPDPTFVLRQSNVFPSADAKGIALMYPGDLSLPGLNLSYKKLFGFIPVVRVTLLPQPGHQGFTRSKLLYRPVGTSDWTVKTVDCMNDFFAVNPNNNAYEVRMQGTSLRMDVGTSFASGTISIP